MIIYDMVTQRWPFRMHQLFTTFQKQATGGLERGTTEIQQHCVHLHLGGKKNIENAKDAV